MAAVAGPVDLGTAVPVAGNAKVLRRWRRARQTRAAGAGDY